PRDSNSAGPKIAGSRENHLAIIFPRQPPTQALDFLSRRSLAKADGLRTLDSEFANARTQSAPAGNSAGCKPTPRDPWPGAREISGSTGRLGSAWSLQHQSHGMDTPFHRDMQQKETPPQKCFLH